MSLPFRDPIDDIANAYQASQILLAANRLGLFAAIGNEVKTADDLAVGAYLDPAAECIGAGPGGYIAAIRAAQHGMSVACIDEWKNRA